MTVGDKIGGFFSYFNPLDDSFHAQEQFGKLSQFQKFITVVATAFGTLLAGVGAVAAFRVCVKKFSPSPVDPGQAEKIKATFAATKNVPPKDSGPAGKSKGTVDAAKVLAAAPKSPNPLRSVTQSPLQPQPELRPSTTASAPIAAPTASDLLEVDDLAGSPSFQPDMDVESDEPRKSMLGRLEKYLSVSQEKVGSAKDDGDCFFDSVAQELRAQNIDPTASVKELRLKIANSLTSSLEAQAIAKKFAEHDAHVTYDSYKELVQLTADELNEEATASEAKNEPVNQKLYPIMDRREQVSDELEKLRAQRPTADRLASIERLEKEDAELDVKQTELMKQRVAQRLPIWGSELREGKILSQLYQVNIEVVKIEPNQEPQRYTITHPKGAGYTRTIKIALYDPHFVPIFPKTTH